MEDKKRIGYLDVTIDIIGIIKKGCNEINNDVDRCFVGLFVYLFNN